MEPSRTLVVCGSGAVKEKNVVALLNDHLTNLSSDITVVSVGDTPAAEYAARWASDRDIKVERISDLVMTQTAHPVLVAWNDDDPFCFKVAEFCSLNRVGALDLCHGLLPLNLRTEQIPAPPQIPEQEMLRPGEEIVPTLLTELSDEEFDDDDEDDELSESEKEDVLRSVMDEVMEAIEAKIGPAIKEILRKVLFGEEGAQ